MINNLFNLKIPWIITRRRILLAVSIDFILNSYLYSKGYLITFNALPNPIVTTSLSTFWVISSYILGRYMICKNINFIEIIKTFIKSISIFVICNLIYLFINIFYKFFIFILNGQNNFIEIQKDETLLFFRITLLISLISWIIQYVVSIITNNIYNKKKKWLFFGTKESYLNFKKEVNLQFKNLNFKRLDINSDINKLNYESIEGIILENNNDLDSDDLEKILFFKSKGINVLNTLKWCELVLHRIPPYLIENKYQIIEKFTLSDNSIKFRIKRMGDFFLSLILLLITIPIFLIISICIYIEDYGSIFYSQERTGYKGEIIRIYKFRSMVKDAEKYGAQWSSQGDKRITRVGRIIRAARLDELPQLFSVLKGEMSLIGPRPERPEIEEKLLQKIPYYNYRNLLKPGISGWAQVNYPYGASIKDTINKLSYDIYYINHISFLLDLFILFKTIKLVFNAKGYKPNN